MSWSRISHIQWKCWSPLTACLFLVQVLVSYLVAMFSYHLEAFQLIQRLCPESMSAFHPHQSFLCKPKLWAYQLTCLQEWDAYWKKEIKYTTQIKMTLNDLGLLVSHWDILITGLFLRAGFCPSSDNGYAILKLKDVRIHLIFQQKLAIWAIREEQAELGWWW